MKPSERLAKIESREYAHEKTCSCGNDIPWLVDRVKKLEAALEKIRNAGYEDVTECPCDYIARKALEDE